MWQQVDQALAATGTPVPQPSLLNKQQGLEMQKQKHASDAKKSTWLYHPALPLQYYPIFVWPLRPLAALKFLVGRDFMWSLTLPFGIMAALTWAYLTPPAERMASFDIQWIGLIWLRNLIMLVLLAQALHLYFFTYRKQGDDRRFDARDYPMKSRQFAFGDQYWDNVFWSIVSGLSFWTLYEIGFLYLYANGSLPFATWSWDVSAALAENPLWFLFLFVFVIFWQSTHFYWVHKFLHWGSVYKVVHSVHHRNVNVGPWSGISMHWIEHIVYFSSVLIHLVIPSHPIHVIFHLQLASLGAVIFHTGFEGVVVKGRLVWLLGIFHHQVHHRYYNCNYGTEAIAWDKWFGWDHDGTEEATRRLMKELREKNKAEKMPSGRPTSPSHD
ncbi:MAG: sterol desaturase family protein [Roseovarius sp.]